MLQFFTTRHETIIVQIRIKLSVPVSNVTFYRNYKQRLSVCGHRMPQMYVRDVISKINHDYLNMKLTLNNNNELHVFRCSFGLKEGKFVYFFGIVMYVK